MKSLAVKFTLFFFFLTFCLSNDIIFAQAESGPEQLKIDPLITNYYQNPDAAAVVPAVREYLESRHFMSGEAHQSGSSGILAYAVGRIAMREPSLVPQFQGLLDGLGHDARLWVLSVLQIAGNNGTKKLLEEKLADPDYEKEKPIIEEMLQKGVPLQLNILSREITQSADLDFAWAEFLVTGDEEPVKKIIRVLAWQDETRVQLSAYFQNNASPELATQLKDFGIVADPEKKQILSTDDMDIRFAFGLNDRRLGDEFKALNEKVKFSNETVLHLATKGAAAWALESNAIQHEKVYEILESELPSLTGEAKIAALAIAAGVNTYLGYDEPAARYLEELTALSPYDGDSLVSLARVYLHQKKIDRAAEINEQLTALDGDMAVEINHEIKLARLLDLDTDDLEPAAVSEDIAGIRKRVQDWWGATRAYYGTYHIRDLNNEMIRDGNFLALFFNFKHVKPDNYDIEQVAVADGVADKWLTINGEDFGYFGFWIKIPSDAAGESGRKETNELLNAVQYVSFLEETEPVRIKAYKYSGGDIYEIYYDSVVDGKRLEINGEATESETHFFIDRESGALLKVSSTVKGPANDDEIINFAREYVIERDNTLTIEPPKDLISIPQKEK